MEEWKEYSLSDIAKYSQGKQIPIQLQYEEKNDSLIRFIRIVDYTSNWSQPPRYVLKDSKYHIKSDDIIMIRYGTPGKVFRGHEGLIANNMFKISVNEDIIDKGFAFWYLSMDIIFKQLMSFQASTTMPAISFGMLKNIAIKVPSKKTQLKIIKIFDTIDDKIEVNRRINEQLEELAGALFKSWFVDFEPFKDGEFVDSELGMIPKGWKVGTLGEVCEKITDGSHYSPKDNPMCNIPMLSVKDMQKYSFDYNKSKHIDEEEYAKMKANDCVPLLNDILVAKDGSYLKEIFICKKEIKQAILSSIAIFRANKSIIYPIILLCILKSPKTLKNVSENYVSGSALPRIVLKDFKRYNIIIPPLESQRRFNDIVCAIYDKIYANVEEIHHLTTLRDTLLPKLMSGEIDVNEVEI